jgi:hypothetical protein
MTDYVKSTNFASKDSLASGNPLKIVKGTEIDAEFNSIATAVATKADLNSPTFIGTPAAPTASSGTNTTQLATTAFVTAALQAVYPVGSIYINAGVSTNPNTLLGFGTWTAFGAGRVMVGLNGSDTLFDALEETGGSKDAVVVSHTHTATSTVTDPGHAHPIQRTSNDGNFTTAFDVPSDGPANTYFTNTSTATTGITVATTNASTGSSGTNANLPPYITVAMWKRTA